MQLLELCQQYSDQWYFVWDEWLVIRMVIDFMCYIYGDVCWLRGYGFVDYVDKINQDYKCQLVVGDYVQQNWMKFQCFEIYEIMCQ